MEKRPMNYRRPTAINKKHKPVVIFENDKEVGEFESIQKAAKWLKSYLNLKSIPYNPVFNGMFYDEEWINDNQTYIFTTDEAVQKEKILEINDNQKKIQPTGYWTFFCNPQKWAIDDFLKSGPIYDTFSINEWQRDWFKKGQLGVIRVGHDKRNKIQLNAKNRLQRGIYAIVEIIETPLISSMRDEHWLIENDGEKETYRVPIKYVKNLLNEPILLEDLAFKEEIYDRYLIEGFQASSIPLKRETFEAILNQLNEPHSLDFEIENQKELDITYLEREYQDAVPLVKERVSRVIERGKIAQEYKKVTGFKCQICEAKGENPYTFKKTNGEFYIESHHITQVSTLERGVLGINNLITVCATHHRQLHYGHVEIVENTDSFIIYAIDNEIIKITKYKY